MRLTAIGASELGQVRKRSRCGAMKAMGTLDVAMARAGPETCQLVPSSGQIKAALSRSRAARKALEWAWRGQYRGMAVGQQQGMGTGGVAVDRGSVGRGAGNGGVVLAMDAAQERS